MSVFFISRYPRAERCCVLYSLLIHEIEIYVYEDPCPKCNEFEVMILSLIPNGQSISANCTHCQYEYRIKMDPDDPNRIITPFNVNIFITAAVYNFLSANSEQPFYIEVTYE